MISICYSPWAHGWALPQNVHSPSRRLKCISRHMNFITFLKKHKFPYALFAWAYLYACVWVGVLLVLLMGMLFNQKGWGALHRACAGDNIDTLKWLLELRVTQLSNAGELFFFCSKPTCMCAVRWSFRHKQKLAK